MMEAEDYETEDIPRIVEGDIHNVGGIDAIPPLDLKISQESGDINNGEKHKRVGGAAMAGGFTGALLSAPLVAVDVTILAVAGPLVVVAAAGGCAYMAATHPASAKELFKKGGDAMKEAGDNWKRFHEANNSKRWERSATADVVEKTKDGYAEKTQEEDATGGTPSPSAVAENKKRFVWPFQKEKSAEIMKTAALRSNGKETQVVLEAPKQEDTKKRFPWPFAKKESFTIESPRSADMDDSDDTPRKELCAKESGDYLVDAAVDDLLPDLRLAESLDDENARKSAERCGGFCLPWAGKCQNNAKALSPRKEGENLFHWIHQNMMSGEQAKTNTRNGASGKNSIQERQDGDDETTEMFEDESLEEEGEEEEELTFGNEGDDLPQTGVKLFSNDQELVRKLS
jgi:hypothetical protein